MQIASTPQTGTTSSLSSVSRSAVGQETVETRSRVLPAVQQPVEVEASINRQNPANRPTLVDEQVRLYGPFKGANTTANNASATGTDSKAADAAAVDIAIADQAQGQPSGGDAGTKDDQSQTSAETGATDTQARDAANADPADKSRDAANDKAQTSSADADKKAAAARDARIEQVQQQQVSKLVSRDREVRAHEAAHASIGGQYAGGASFTMEKGPNGINYAIGGEVPIDISAVPDDPEATIRKMQTVQRAALAPADPSSADRAVAAQATQIAQQARAQLQSDQAAARDAKVEAAYEQRMEAAKKREEISDRIAGIQNQFDVSGLLGDAQRSRQFDIVTQRYSPLRPGMIGTLFDETV